MSLRMPVIKGARFGGSPLFLAGLLLAIAPAAWAQWRPYTLVDAFANSEPITIQNALHGWRGADRSGRRQYAAAWAECGVTNGRWGVGTLRRQDYSLRFTPDAAELYGTIADDRPLPVGRAYDLEVHGHALEAWGIRAFLQHEPVQGLKTEIGLSLLRGTYMFEGSIRGAGIITAPKTYEYALWADYTYTKDFLFDREVQPQKGVGASLDCSVDWAFREAWQLRARVIDVPGIVLWKGMPYTQASAVSQRTHTDDQDFQHWDPLISGLESEHTRFRQSLPPRGSGDLYYLGTQWISAFGATYCFGDWSPRLGLGRTVGGWRWLAWLCPGDRAIGLNLQRGRWSLGLTMDNPRPDRAHMLQCNFSYRP